MKGVTLISGIGLGAGLMYVLDPDRGRRRRALLRDKMVHTINKTGSAIETTSHDVKNRTRGAVAEIKSLFSQEDVSDGVLVERVRSRLGRVSSHPGAIHVTADRGKVTLSGSVLRNRLNDVLNSVRSVKGVNSVENRLDVHSDPGGIPDLQGGVPRPGERFELLQSNWAPSARLLVGAGGAALMAYCAARRDAIGTSLGTLGFGLFLRSLTNKKIKRLIELSGRRGVDIQKTINIDAPLDRVFEIWTKYENFPHFMSHVLEVRDIGEGQSHWVVSGPAGTSIEWDAETTRIEPNRLLAWKTRAGSVVEHAGIVEFEPTRNRGTRVGVRLSYNPPAGVLGHTIASILGADPKSRLDEDLMRMKDFIESEIRSSRPGEDLLAAREATTRSR